jgi:hypothetical protein
MASVLYMVMISQQIRMKRNYVKARLAQGRAT